MEKTELLKTRSGKFRELLRQHEDSSSDATLLLKWLTPLFDDIELGKVVPPTPYGFLNALGKDNPFYEPDKPFSAAEADFVSALEDWESQPWYQMSSK